MIGLPSLEERAAAAGAMDIAVVAVDVRSIGGMDRQLRMLITGLLERGHRVTLISRTSAVEDHANLVWKRVPGPSRPFPIGYVLFVILASARLWRLRSAVVHTTGAVAWRRGQITTIHLLHAGYAAKSNMIRASRNSFAYRLSARISRLLSLAAERLIMRPRQVAAVVTVSRGVAAEMQEHYPWSSDRLHVIPNGVDTEAFSPSVTVRAAVRQQIGALETELVCLFVGNEWKAKGLELAIAAVGRVDHCKLVVVGTGDVRHYETLAAAAGAGDRVFFVGSSDDVASWYRAADTFILPSTYETFSLVTYEAAASGLPLLVTRVSGVEDILQEGVNGWEISTAESIAVRLQSLLSEPALRGQMGVRSRAAVMQYGWSRMVESYIDLYRRVAGSAL